MKKTKRACATGVALRKLFTVMVALFLVFGFNACSNSGGGGGGPAGGPGSKKDKNKGGIVENPIDRSATDGSNTYVVDPYDNGSGSGSNGDNNIGGSGDSGLGGKTTPGSAGTGGTKGDSGTEKAAGTTDENGNTIGSGGDNGGTKGGGNGWGSDPQSPDSDLLPLVFELIRGGTYMMGKAAETPDALFNPGYGVDDPPHQVTVSDFYMGKYELTQEQFFMVTGRNPSEFRHQRNLPLETISFYDAIDFCNKLTIADMGAEHQVYKIEGINIIVDSTKKGYRLATEEEWEYAIRANANPITRTYLGNGVVPSTHVNYAYQGYGKTVPAAAYPPNPWGLYNMMGNVAEWVYGFTRQIWSPSRTVITVDHDVPIIRGGQYMQNATSIYSATRGTMGETVWHATQESTGNGCGLRIARSAF